MISTDNPVRRLGKLLGLAGLASILALALFGASSASATALCGEKPEVVGEELVCKEGTELSVVELEAENEGTVTFETSVGNVNCAESSFKGEAKSFSEEVNGEMEAFTFEECTDTIAACTIEKTFVYTPFNFRIIAVRTVAPEGLVEIIKPKTEIKFDCGLQGKITCLYGDNVGETVLGDAYNAAQQVKVNGLLNKSGGPALCPAKATLQATFNIWRTVAGNKKVLYVAHR